MEPNTQKKDCTADGCQVMELHEQNDELIRQLQYSTNEWKQKNSLDFKNLTAKRF